MGSASALDGSSSFCLGPEKDKRTCSCGAGATCKRAFSCGAFACSGAVARYNGFTREYGRGPWDYGAKSRGHDGEPREHGPEPGKHGGRPWDYDAESRKHGSRPWDYGSRPWDDAEPG